MNRLTIEGYIVYIKKPKDVRVDGMVLVEFGTSYNTFINGETKRNNISCFKKDKELNGLHKAYKAGDHILFEGNIFSYTRNGNEKTGVYIREIVPIRTFMAVHRKRKESSIDNRQDIPGFDGLYSE